MGYSAEVITRARRLLEANNAQIQAQEQARLRDAYAKVPRLKEIDNQLRSTMVFAAQAAFARGEEAHAIMEDAKQANMALQQERKALADANFGPGYFEQDTLCESCGGTGYIGSTMCHCLEELCRQEQKKEVSLLSCGQCRFEDFRLDYYPDRKDADYDANIRTAMTNVYKVCKQYAEEFPGQTRNLLFSGDTGLGKTFLSACIATTVTDKGYSVAYESAQHLFNWLEKARFTGDPEQKALAEAQCAKYTTCDLLIVDDLGTELSGQFVTAALYTLLNDRLLSGKNTIISTNLRNEELESRYSSQILSRLRGNYRRVVFLGDDIRVLKNKGVLR